MIEESVTTFETHLTAVMDSLIRASVCEISKLFKETVHGYLVELSLNRKENDALKLRLRLTENKLRTERKYGMGWAASRRNAGLAGAEEGSGVRQKRKVEVARGKSKKAIGTAYRKGWPGAMWVEGGAQSDNNNMLSGRNAVVGAVGLARGPGPGARGEKEAREMYLIQLPRGEEDEMLENEEGEGSFDGEGEETTNIKEEYCQVEEYQPASLKLIKEALKLDTPVQNLHTCSRAQSEVDASEHPTNLQPAQRNVEEWQVGAPVEPSEGGMTVDQLRGLESALKAEKSREEAAMTVSQPVASEPVAVSCSKMNLPQKYIGLDGLEQDGEHRARAAAVQMEEQMGQRAAKERLRPAVFGGVEGRTGWSKKTRDSDTSGGQSGEEMMEQGESEHPPQLSTSGSVGESGEEEGGDFLHFCPQCGGGFPSLAEMEEHPCPLGGANVQSTDGEENVYPCAHCGNTFSHAWALKNHECACAAERPHCCEICGKRFTHSRSLERHHLVHSGERPHTCPQCGRSFSRLGNLERHQRIHTGERPYGCEACGKRFSRVEYLKRHQLIHNSEKVTLTCSNCGVTCSDVEQMKAHQCF
ncbi:zinc finger protein 696 isoform X1 [Synchiropus splendidus]|uniref:zinc finger protein 696 isoform X1 n=1 Tax=Synchiropus splendidus TaxID=270530 RepID=UPI00237E5893|nr:zinc finger protein 696 isoform X1 [Synchiropus splendidus]